MKQTIFSLGILLVLAACSSTPKAPQPVDEPVLPKVDYLEVQNSLGLDLPPGKTGFKEKMFDACYLGEALKSVSPPIQDCRRAYYSLVQVQLSCRHTEDTSNVFASHDLLPVAHQKLTYRLGSFAGVSETNDRGEATFRSISSRSMKKNYLRISTGSDFLMMKAGDATEIVTPPAWCGSTQ